MVDRSFALTPGKRVLYLTKDPDKIRAQLAGTLHLTLDDVRADELLDDINTDAMTPAWVCFDYDPAAIANNAYAGLVVGGQRLIPTAALRDGGFEVIVAGAQKGVGSSREHAAQAEVFSGSKLAIASSFAPIHARNNINIGQLMGDHAMLRRLERGEAIPLEEFTAGHDAITTQIIVAPRQDFVFSISVYSLHSISVVYRAAPQSCAARQLPRPYTTPPAPPPDLPLTSGSLHRPELSSRWRAMSTRSW